MKQQKFFDDLFSEGRSLWLKIGGGALAAPLCVLSAALRSGRRGGDDLNLAPGTIALIVLLSAAVGAVLGAALSLKDVVARRVASGQPCPFIAKLFFGYGVLSLLVWAAVAIVGTFVVTMAALTLNA